MPSAPPRYGPVRRERPPPPPRSRSPARSPSPGGRGAVGLCFPSAVIGARCRRDWTRSPGHRGR
ncbi:hypothetical protein BRC89_06325 [Halobacteriales archaeon QS_4_70_19]|nr:MAG: hypothetical protein BRC89_06325 [Halobacteriales archaeon QS_4_70_19]